jgi:hypothetical protein
LTNHLGNGKNIVMQDNYPKMSDGGYRRDEEGRLQLRADFYHPAGGYGYVAEVGERYCVYRAIAGRGTSRFAKDVEVHFQDQEGIEPVRVKRWEETFPASFKAAIEQAIIRTSLES